MEQLMRRRWSRQAGFSLIELMIVVAIAGIIMAVAVPAYQGHIVSVRRGDAQGALMGLASALERYHVINRTFAGVEAEDIHPGKSPVDGSETHYLLSIENADTRSFTVVATPQDAQAKKDKCGALTLTRSGARGVRGSASIERCWRS